MDNHERHTALRTARERALFWAEQAEEGFRQTAYAGNQHRIELARMWAGVAEALKVGEQTSDSA